MLLPKVSGVQLPTAQKPMNRPDWWKGKFALFLMLETGVAGQGGGHLFKGGLPPPQQAGGESFYRQSKGRWLHAEIVQSSLTVIFRLVINGLTSVILIVLGTVNLQFQGWCVPISFWPMLGIMAAHMLGTVWSSYS